MMCTVRDALLEIGEIFDKIIRFVGRVLLVRKIEEDLIAEIDLQENAVYVVCDGQFKAVDTPPTG